MGQLASLTVGLLAQMGEGFSSKGCLWAPDLWVSSKNLSGVAARENSLGFDLELNSEQFHK